MICILRSRPRPEEVVEGGVAVKWLGSAHVAHVAPSCFDAACTAHVTLNLHLAIGQCASIRVAGEDMIGGPLDTVHAQCCVPRMGAGRPASQRRKRGVWATPLKVGTAPGLLLRVPLRLIPIEALELHTSLLLSAAAPSLLRIGPSMQPVGEPRVAVVDLAGGMALPFRVGVTTSMGLHHRDMQLALPCARTAAILVGAAKLLLERRPAKVPVGEAFIAVEVRLRFLLVLDVMMLHHDLGR